MCLQNPGELKIAEKDIIVYKIAMRYRYPHPGIMHKKFVAPFRQSQYTLGQVMYSELEYIPDDYEEGGPIVEAGLHSFGNYKDAKAQCDGWNSPYSDFHYVMHTYIPKGSRYYKGTYDGKVSYASDKIMIVRKMNLWDKIKATLFGNGRL